MSLVHVNWHDTCVFTPEFHSYIPWAHARTSQSNYLSIVGDWISECWDMSTHRWALHTAPVGLQSAP